MRSGRTPAAIQNDIANYTDVQPIIQISDIKVS